MFQVIEKGTAKIAKVKGIEICGKTGTAENFIKINNLKTQLTDHSIFMAFAPRENPKIAIAVFILGIALTNIGFEPNQEQSEDTLKALKDLMSIIPLVGVCISFVLLYFYPIDKTLHEKLVRDIESRQVSNV